MTILKGITQSPFTGRRESHESGAPILDVVGLSVRYDTGIVLDQITFHLHAGERVAVVGPNGAGKSTLFKVIAGVLAPSQGQVTISGHGPAGHICIAYVPQRSQVDWNFPASVADVVMMGRVGKLGYLRWPQRKDWDFVRQALADVGLVDLANRQISELSGGQQQRMFIARSLAQEAQLMLMDEPLTGLDINSEGAILDILEALRQRGVTIMVSTHDLDQAAERFDRVMLLNRRLIGLGTPEQVFTPERLLKAYGGHLRLVKSGEAVVAVADACCDDGDESEWTG